ncbi:MAG: 50S ribosomal protein L9 [Actinobacteria bacterium]|nr:50S ribosomal protein L9 [Actinomycetota bacterium]MSV84854.1 50S ribosomal protein L9 [Actinomycetota bacterium]MSX75465.1 50S ribosomal protein L9 [Actinomycetota bacterium]MSY22340.1 50S ribosomal protein L9 [Actinomycetota bacterium]MTA74432.1 50S ribosomal protein L9 [Actinomycetota bacterium]
MKVILRSDVSGLGKRGDIVEVSKGYVRNFLEPRGLAFLATDGAVEQASAMRRSRDVKDAKDRESAEEIAKKLVSKKIEVVAKAGDTGRLFGSVTEAELVVAILDQTGISLDRKDIVIEEHIKEVGSHQATARLHADVQFPIMIEVVAG